MRAPHRLALVGLLLASLFATSPGEAIVVERVVAVVGDRPILLSELRRRARPFLLQVAAKVAPGAQQAAAESQIFKELIEKMIDEELITQAAEKASIGVTSDEVENALRNIAASQRMSVPEVVRLASESSGLTEQEYRDEIRRQILEGKMLQLRVRNRLRITEQDVQATYDRLVREERRRRDYHPAWVVLRLFPGSSPEALQEREALARELAERARRGEDFAALARQFSDDTATKEAGGDLGVRAVRGTEAAATGRRQTMAAQLETAVLPLEPGQVTDPIRVGDALVVIKLLSRQPSRYTSLQAARPEILARLQSEIMMRARQRWLETLKRRTHLDVRL